MSILRSDVKPKYYFFQAEELVQLSKWLDTQYLPYDNEELHNVVRKIQRIVGEYELARKSGSPTQGS